MDKTKKNGYKKYYSLIVLDIVILVVMSLLFSFSVISLLTFLISLIFIVFFFVLSFYIIIKQKKKVIKKVNLKNEKIIITDQDIINLYGSVGIPIIRDENGKIKDVFQLLGLEMTYDQLGNRLRTIYEKLGIVPRFTKEGKEVPTFMVIKNRVKGFVKPEKKTGTLARVLTEEQKEDLLVRQMLEQKLKESEQVGDAKKAKVIKKVIEQKKKEKAKETPPKKEGFIIIKPSGKAVGVSSSKGGTIKVSGNMISDVFGYKNGTIIKSAFRPNKITGKDNEKQVIPGFSVNVKELNDAQKFKQTEKKEPVVKQVSNPNFLFVLPKVEKIKSEMSSNDSNERIN